MTKEQASDPTRVYTGWLLDPAERAALLARFPPRYARPVAHHVTLKFGDRAASASTDTVGEIIGEADDGCGVQALIVRIGGSSRRPDGGTYHVTWSLAEGREARESNDVIATRGWRAFEAPIPLRLAAKPPD
jgi:hypothetical protein